MVQNMPNVSIGAFACIFNKFEYSQEWIHWANFMKNKDGESKVYSAIISSRTSLGKFADFIKSMISCGSIQPLEWKGELVQKRIGYAFKYIRYCPRLQSRTKWHVKFKRFFLVRLFKAASIKETLFSAIEKRSYGHRSEIGNLHCVHISTCEELVRMRAEVGPR